MRLIDADAFADFIQKTIESCDYRNLMLDECLSVADVLDCVVADLKGEGLSKFKNCPTIPRWISCNERLPEKDGEYLVYGKVVDENEDNHIFIGLYDEGSEGFGWWQDYYDNKTLGFLDSDFTEYATVLAWMPLPDDYEEGDSE